MRKPLIISLLVLAALTAGQAQTPAPAPKEGEAPKAARAPRPPRKTKVKQTDPAKANAKLVDLNGASKQELMALPGVTGAIADRIIAARPIRTKTALVPEGIVPPGIYQGIHDKIVAVQAPAKK
jgi:hypothetical protein